MSDKEVRKCQWIKGDNTGVVETISSEKDNFIIFESGRRINTAVFPEFMMNVDSDVESLITNPISKELVVKEQSSLQQSNSSIITPIQKEVIEVKNPIQILLEKQSKNNKIELNITLDVSVPKKEVLELLQDSFDEDVKEEVLNFAKRNLNNETIITEIHEKLKTSINLYYK